MRRRRFLGTVGSGLLLSGAGCVSGGDGEASSTPERTPTEADTPTPTAAPSREPASDPAPDADVGGQTGDVETLADVDLPLERGPDLKRGAPKDAIPAITEPVFGEDWSDFDASLDAEDRVVGVTVDGHARAYPLGILNWHEVVNDSFGGPLLVSYCPLCGSGVTAQRRVDGEETVFGVSGLLWNNDLVMYDELTESLWSQVFATAVRGPKTGETMTLRPSTITTWRKWRDEHPDTEVLLPPPASNTVTGEQTRNYDANPYDGYDESARIGIGGQNPDDRLHPKTSVIGVATDDVARAYPLDNVEAEGGVVNDTVGDLPVVVATADGSLVAYVRRVDGETLEFDRDSDVLTAGGSRWAIVSGKALDGPHEGTTLERANDRSEMFWFAWADFFPDSGIYGYGE
jgi:hypothetical protein